MLSSEGSVASQRRIAVLSLGGTISSVRDDDTEEGVAPRLGAEQLLARLEGHAADGSVEALTVSTLPSVDLTFNGGRELCIRIRELTGQGVEGFVVTQGTDSMEEMAFLIDLWHQGDVPVVFTGAMADPTRLGSDGSANLVNALRAARDVRLQGGVYVVMDDVLHAARWAAKRHTTARGAFTSAPAGPVGWFSEGRLILASLPLRKSGVPLRDGTRVPAVALVGVGMGDDGSFFDYLGRSAYDGVVVQALGGGHIPSSAVASLHALAERMPVIITSRTGAGATLARTYSYPGSEIDISRGGAVFAGTLDGPKSRVLLTALLMGGIRKQADIAEAFGICGDIG